MRKLKYVQLFENFQVNESGISRLETQEMESMLKDLIEREYTPNIITRDGETRKFNVNLSGSKSKWGTILDVSFLLSYPVMYDEVNDGLKKEDICSVIGDAISDFTNKEVSLYGFNFFGNKVMGKKDGHTKEVEDVHDKFVDLVKELNPDEVSGYSPYSPITFLFLLKDFESFNESLSPLKSLQKELKELNRKRESLIKHGKKLPSPGAYSTKNKLEIEKVDKEIKDVETKIKRLKNDK